MDAQVFAMWFMLPILVLAEAAVVLELRAGESKSHFGAAARRVLGSLARGRRGIPLAVALWLALTAIAWGYEFIIGEVALYILLFSFGRFVALLGVASLIATAAYTPVVTARLVRKLTRVQQGATGVLTGEGS